MVIAAFVMALLSLIFSTASLTLLLSARYPTKNPELNELDLVRERELVEGAYTETYGPRSTVTIPINLTAKEERDLEESFINPDAKFTGIDEEFNV